MGKSKNPRRPKSPPPEKNDAGEQEVKPQTEAKAELVPPARRPPTAVGAETPPPPPPEPPRMRPPGVPEPLGPVLHRFLETLRSAAGRVLDLADAAADTIRKGLEGRA